MTRSASEKVIGGEEPAEAGAAPPIVEFLVVGTAYSEKLS